MTNLVSPLVKFETARRDTFEVGNLVTVELWAGKGKTVQSGAVVNRREAGTVFVKLCGLTVPRPYEIGQPLALNTEKVVDW